MPPSTANKIMSKRDEQRLITAYKRMVLGGGFPNADRVGCPGSAILKSMAFRQIDLGPAAEYMQHVGCCSPCFAEYEEFRDQLLKRHRIQLVATCALVFIAIAITAWLWVGRGGRAPQNIVRRSEPPLPPYQQALLDLRGKSVTRGEDIARNQRPLAISRNRLALLVYLPLGSEEGRYDVQIRDKSENPVLATEGLARLQKGLTTLEIRLDTTTIHPGTYSFGVRQHGRYWNFYPVLVK